MAISKYLQILFGFERQVLVLMQVDCHVLSNQKQQQPLSSEHTFISRDCAAQ